MSKKPNKYQLVSEEFLDHRSEKAVRFTLFEVENGRCHQSERRSIFQGLVLPCYITEHELKMNGGTRVSSEIFKSLHKAGFFKRFRALRIEVFHARSGGVTQNLCTTQKEDGRYVTLLKQRTCHFRRAAEHFSGELEDRNLDICAEAVLAEYKEEKAIIKAELGTEFTNMVLERGNFEKQQSDTPLPTRTKGQEWLRETSLPSLRPSCRPVPFSRPISQRSYVVYLVALSRDVAREGLQLCLTRHVLSPTDFNLQKMDVRHVSLHSSSWVFNHQNNPVKRCPRLANVLASLFEGSETVDNIHQKAKCEGADNMQDTKVPSEPVLIKHEGKPRLDPLDKIEEELGIGPELRSSCPTQQW